MTGQAQDPTTTFLGKEGRPARILLFRHGAAEGSEEGRFISRTDTDLLPSGEEQVRRAARRAAHWLEGAGEAAVYSSPLLRARRTAEILMAEIPMEDLSRPGGDGGLRILEDLIELDLGRWEGETYDSLMEKDPERMRSHYADFVHSRAPGGESLSDLAERVRPAFRRVREAAAGKAAIVAAHAAVNRVIVCDALGAPLSSFFRIELGYASLCVIDYHGEVPVVRLLNG